MPEVALAERGRAAMTVEQTAELEAREQSEQSLQDFQGGGVSVYLGSGALVVIILLLLIILL